MTARTAAPRDERRELRSRGLGLRPGWIIRGFADPAAAPPGTQTSFDLERGIASTPEQAITEARRRYPEKMARLQGGYWRAFPIVQGPSPEG